MKIIDVFVARDIDEAKMRQSGFTYSPGFVRDGYHVFVDAVEGVTMAVTYVQSGTSRWRVAGVRVNRPALLLEGPDLPTVGAELTIAEGVGCQERVVRQMPGTAGATLPNQQCGEPVVRADLCQTHLEQATVRASTRVDVLRADLAEAWQELQVLRGEKRIAKPPPTIWYRSTGK